ILTKSAVPLLDPPENCGSRADLAASQRSAGSAPKKLMDAPNPNVRRGFSLASPRYEPSAAPPRGSERRQTVQLRFPRERRPTIPTRSCSFAVPATATGHRDTTVEVPQQTDMPAIRPAR